MTDEEPVVVGQVERPSRPPFVLYGCKRHAAASPKAVMRKTLRDRVIESAETPPPGAEA
jgi:hypothetical protein